MVSFPGRSVESWTGRSVESWLPALTLILADDYQVKMLQAAHKYNRTEENMEVKMVAARIQNGYKPGGGIRANEIKGFLNIWCNQRRLKPEYDFIEAGFHLPT